jgi:hypothetical protein
VDSASACPKCGYARKPSDTAPALQCPSCHVAIEKYRAAAANPVTAALVREHLRAEVPPQLPIERRLGMAMFDLVMAGAFLWCWLSPSAWRPTLTGELGLLMLMEFFTLHSAMFLVGGSSEGGASMKLATAFFVMLFYIPVAGAFALWHGGWWPALAFAWLLASRVATMLAGQGASAYESKRAAYYWGAAGGYYILFAMVALLLPMPELGLAGGLHGWAGFWAIPPQDVMAWGFLYFGALGMTKLLEKPAWIVAEPE